MYFHLLGVDYAGHLYGLKDYKYYKQLIFSDNLLNSIIN